MTVLSPMLLPAKMTAPEQIDTPDPMTSGESGARLLVDLRASLGCLPSTTLS